MEVLLRIPKRLEKFVEFIPEEELPEILLSLIENGIKKKQTASPTSTDEVVKKILMLLEMKSLPGFSQVAATTQGNNVSTSEAPNSVVSDVRVKFEEVRQDLIELGVEDEDLLGLLK